MRKKTVTQVHEEQGVPYRSNTNSNRPRYVATKMTKTKVKGRTLKATREQQHITYKGTPIKLSTDFSVETV